MERRVWKCSWMPLRMEGASKKRREGYCSHKSLCLLWLCENASLSLRFHISSCEDNSSYTVIIKKKGESCFSMIVHARLGAKNLQAKALLKLILMIPTCIKCVNQAMPTWHRAFKNVWFPLLQRAQWKYTTKHLKMMFDFRPSNPDSHSHI